jgi:hypothetical protein
VTVLAFALSTTMLAFAAPAGAQAAGPQPQSGVVYSSAGDPQTRAVVANEQQQPVLLFDVAIAPCEELTLETALNGGGTATVKPDGTFRGTAQLGALELTDEVEVELRGRFLDANTAELTVSYDYENKRITDVGGGEPCKGEDQIQLTGAADPGAQRITGVFDVPGQSLGGSSDAVYVADASKRRLTMLAADSGAEEWSTRTKLSITSLAAGDDAAWALAKATQYADHFLVQYDAKSGKEAARLNFDTASKAVPYGHIAVTPGGIWVPDDQERLFRIDPETAEVAGKIRLGGSPTAMVAGPNGVYLVIEAGAGETGSRLVLVDDETGDTTSEVDLGDDFDLSGGDALGADDAHVWLASDDAESGQSIIEQRDALTLELVAQTPPYPTESVLGVDILAAAPPGVFANITGVDGSVSILDEALATIANVPILDVGPLEMVAAGDAVWVIEGQGLDVLVRLATG